MNLISVIIINWNAMEYLKGCIQSILGNTEGGAVEIIVVDNGSTDGSVRMIQDDFPGVVLIRNESNVGFARANNIGIERAKGDYLFFINSDVVVLENCMAPLKDFLDSNRDVGLVAPQILNGDRTVQTSCVRFPSLWGSLCRMVAADKIFETKEFFHGQLSQVTPGDKMREVEVIKGCFWAARKDVVLDVGLLDEGFFIYAEDWDWCRRFEEKGYKRVYYPECKAIHFGGGSSRMEPMRFFLERNKANLMYWEKHEGRPRTCIYKCLLVVHEILRWSAFRIMKAFGPAEAENEAEYKISRSRTIIKKILSGAL